MQARRLWTRTSATVWDYGTCHYGIMVRVTDVHPRELGLPESHWWWALTLVDRIVTFDEKR